MTLRASDTQHSNAQPCAECRYPEQGTQTEGEGSVQLTSSLK
jgi:hypothetical protein